MGPEQHDGALTETATEIERALQAALAIDASPEFVARVRTRLANEPAASNSWRWPWPVAAAAAVAAAIALALAFSRPPAVPQPDATSSIAKADIPLESAASPVVSGFSRTVDPPAPKASGSRTVVQARPTAPARSTEPEILIDSRESMALRRLIDGTRDGSLDLSAALQATTPAALEPTEISDVVIAPITIEPLAPADGAEGVRP